MPAAGRFCRSFFGRKPTRLAELSQFAAGVESRRLMNRNRAKTHELGFSIDY